MKLRTTLSTTPNEETGEISSLGGAPLPGKIRKHNSLFDFDDDDGIIIMNFEGQVAKLAEVNAIDTLFIGNLVVSTESQ